MEGKNEENNKTKTNNEDSSDGRQWLMFHIVSYFVHIIPEDKSSVNKQLTLIRICTKR